MSDASAIDAASRRLSAALDALEAAAERRRQSDHGEDRLAAQVQALGTDRSKLAADLDAQAARSNRLETTNREVARRLDLAIDTIRSWELVMAHVSVTINGRQYRMACEDGQENHLIWLSGDLDRRIGQLRDQFGEIGDMRLTMMAALTVADELVEAGKRLRRLEEELASLQDARAVATERAQATQAAVAAALNSAAERIERVIKGLNRGLGENVAIG